MGPVVIVSRTHNVRLHGAGTLTVYAADPVSPTADAQQPRHPARPGNWFTGDVYIDTIAAPAGSFTIRPGKRVGQGRPLRAYCRRL